MDPGFIGPADAAAGTSDLAPDAFFLQFAEAGVGRFEVQERKEVAAVVQQDGLHLGNGHFPRLAAGFSRVPPFISQETEMALSATRRSSTSTGTTTPSGTLKDGIFPNHKCESSSCRGFWTW